VVPQHFAPRRVHHGVPVAHVWAVWLDGEDARHLPLIRDVNSRRGIGHYWVPVVPRRSAPRWGRHGVPVGLHRSPVVPRHLAPRWVPRGVPVKILPHYAPLRVRPGQGVKR